MLLLAAASGCDSRQEAAPEGPRLGDVLRDCCKRCLKVYKGPGALFCVDSCSARPEVPEQLVGDIINCAKKCVVDDVKGDDSRNACVDACPGEYRPKSS